MSEFNIDERAASYQLNVCALFMLQLRVKRWQVPQGSHDRHGHDMGMTLSSEHVHAQSTQLSMSRSCQLVMKLQNFFSHHPTPRFPHGTPHCRSNRTLGVFLPLHFDDRA